MGGTTKIVVLKAREFVYTLIFLALIILLVCVFVWMFASDKNKDVASLAVYNPGIYYANISIGNEPLNLEVTVDEMSITHVGLHNTSETITTMYPLIDTAIEELNSQLGSVQSIDDLVFSGENQYTAIVIKQALRAAIEKATIQ